MGQPAVVANDQVTGMCAGHQIIGPGGSPAPGPPLPFQAMLTVGLATTVLVGGVPAAVVGSKGVNTPPHVGLHTSDPMFVPTRQEAEIAVGSTTVLFDGKAAAYTGCQAVACLSVSPQVVGTGATVLVGS